MREPVVITFIVASGVLNIPLKILFLRVPFWSLTLSFIILPTMTLQISFLLSALHFPHKSRTYLVMWRSGEDQQQRLHCPNDIVPEMYSWVIPQTFNSISGLKLKYYGLPLKEVSLNAWLKSGLWFWIYPLILHLCHFLN